MRSFSSPVDLTHAARIVVDDFHAAPCAVVAAAWRVKDEFIFGTGAYGALSTDDDAPLASTETPFDLASVTKPITSLTMARLVRRSVVFRDEPLANVLPALAKTASARVTLDLLAAHRAGLDAHGGLYTPLVHGADHIDRDDALLQAANMRHTPCPDELPPDGFVPVYSDLGYLLLGAALEARTNMDLDALMVHEVVAPLGLRLGSARQLRTQDPSFDTRVAPTEIVPFRGGTVRGAVHDENAWAYAQYGAAGHAGFFGTATDVARLGAAVLDVLADRRPNWLSSNDLEPLVRARAGGSLRAGFDGRSGDAPSSGSRLGPRTFGHLGFTGTSMWIDPDAEFVGVLLSNRVFPTRTSLAIRQARPAAYDAMFQLMTTSSR
ncbi:MAG TPA: serine hydrolase domain-containing protein [Polyangium sp.]|nr:serine hydrolase domain-containing protein [Polyangium sp.]